MLLKEIEEIIKTIDPYEYNGDDMNRLNLCYCAMALDSAIEYYEQYFTNDKRADKKVTIFNARNLCESVLDAYGLATSTIDEMRNAKNKTITEKMWIDYHLSKTVQYMVLATNCYETAVNTKNLEMQSKNIEKARKLYTFSKG